MAQTTLLDARRRLSDAMHDADQQILVSMELAEELDSAWDAYDACLTDDLRAQVQQLRDAGLRLAAESATEAASLQAEIERLKEELGYVIIQRDDARYGSQTHQATIERLRASLEKHHLPRHASNYTDCGLCGEPLTKP